MRAVIASSTCVSMALAASGQVDDRRNARRPRAALHAQRAAARPPCPASRRPRRTCPPTSCGPRRRASTRRGRHVSSRVQALRRPAVGDDRRRDADVDDVHAPGEARAARGEETELVVSERRGHLRLHRDAERGARVDVEPGRQVDREASAGRRVHGEDDVRLPAVDRAVQAGAEERVDDNLAARRGLAAAKRGARPEAATGPPLRSRATRRGSARASRRHGLRIAGEEDDGASAAHEQVARDDEPVPSVVRPRHKRSRCARRARPPNRARSRAHRSPRGPRSPSTASSGCCTAFWRARRTRGSGSSKAPASCRRTASALFGGG